MQGKQRLMLKLLLRQNKWLSWRQTRPPTKQGEPAPPTPPTEDQGLYPWLAHATPFERGTSPQCAIFDAFLVPDDAPGPRALFTYTFMLPELLYYFCLSRFHFSFPLSVHFLSSFCIRFRFHSLCRSIYMHLYLQSLKYLKPTIHKSN